MKHLRKYKIFESNTEIDKICKKYNIINYTINSDNSVYENIKTLKNNLKKLKYNQKQLSKKQKGSISRNKQRIKLSIIHEKITNYLHKISTEIIKNHDIICVKYLSVKIS
jgi:putative transposase